MGSADMVIAEIQWSLIGSAAGSDRHDLECGWHSPQRCIVEVAGMPNDVPAVQRCSLVAGVERFLAGSEDASAALRMQASHSLISATYEKSNWAEDAVHVQLVRRSFHEPPARKI